MNSYLVIGLVEIVLCPLPGISIGQGLTDVGVGMLAPFKLTINVLALPGRLCVQ